MSLNNHRPIEQNGALERQADIILSFAKTLFVNGETTTQVINETKKIAKTLNLGILIMVRWGQLSLQIRDSTGAQISCVIEADPVAVHMGKVIATVQTLEAFNQGKSALEQAYESLVKINKKPPYTTGLFSLAAAMGAMALGLIFGVSDWSSAALIFLSAALGGVSRRYLATISTNMLAQSFLAAGIAGVIGAMAVNYHLSSSLRLVALCPCMVLVPGPHFLNSALDFIHGRMHLGLARLAYAGLICISISLGVLVGLRFLGVSLPINPSSHMIVPLWLDMMAAGIAIIAYSIFFSTPFRLIMWPLIIGVLAHMLRWQSIVILGNNIAVASFIACLLVGLVLTFVAYNKHTPFASLAFAAVVSMIPGVFLFRMASGIITLTSYPQISLSSLSQTIFDGSNALVITLAISIGLLGPKVILDKIRSLRLK
jgi:uncharacterized membrane protein YjjP (DUF1212 family)